MDLSQQRQFPRSRRSIGAARAFTIDVLTEWGIADRREDMRLCVSELATNALLHGVPPGREFSVGLFHDGATLRLEVRDSGDGIPKTLDPDADATTGRGLHLVREVADDFGIDAHVVGKTVWTSFEIAHSPLEGAR
ncbi:ATP-binding protein [Streptomyces niveus]|uniref:ATP-binding protein n=1 Tax=Streptomyces niveus TaxID=193462 RepID=UPI0036416FD3